MSFQIIPIVTEKANAISEKTNRFSFKVSPDATKPVIKHAVEELYDVKVVEVKTMNYEGKHKQRYTRRGLQRGKVAAFKKAIVTLAEGQTIDFYSNL
ncbi:MAG: 50S ribosomal protein L23 [Muribaculaceae bacterium]|nr:50S ribosomal protein L23 [Muribaculaceae bacterium]